MKKIIILAVAFIIASPGLFAQQKAGRIDLTQHTILHGCSMLPNVTIYSHGKYNMAICGSCGIKQNLSQKELFKAQVTNPNGCPMSGYAIRQVGKQNLSLKEQMKLEGVNPGYRMVIVEKKA